MTDQYTSLRPAALKDIIAHIDESLAVFSRHSHPLSESEVQIKRMLGALRARLAEKLANHPESEI